MAGQQLAAVAVETWSGVLYDGTEGTYVATDAATLKTLQTAITTNRFRVQSKSSVSTTTTDDALKSLAGDAVQWDTAMIILVGNRRTIEEVLVDGDGYKVMFSHGSHGHDKSYHAVQVQARPGTVTFELEATEGSFGAQVVLQPMDGGPGLVEQLPMSIRPASSEAGPAFVEQRPMDDGPMFVEQRPMSFQPESLE